MLTDFSRKAHKVFCILCNMLMQMKAAALESMKLIVISIQPITGVFGRTGC